VGSNECVKVLGIIGVRAK